MLDVNIDEKKVRERFIEAAARRARDGRADEAGLKAYKTRLAELDRLIQAAFENRTLRDMPEDVFARLCAKYRDERLAVEKSIAAIEKNGAENGFTADEYIRRLKLYGGCDTLTREVCLQLIDFITVGEKTTDGAREIHIYYRFSCSHSA